MFSRIFSILILSVSTISPSTWAQPQWKFHVAFEDATGAKDTLWMIYDTAATFGIDTAFNEGSVAINPTQFSLWILNNNFDSTKTQALPYTNFPNHALWGIEAINYQYPIQITWDTLLFHAPYLPTHATIGTAKIYNDYFWGVNNDPPLQAYNMIIDNHANAPAFSWGSQNHFPMDIIFYQSTVGQQELNSPDVDNIFPNPTRDAFYIISESEIEKVVLADLHGISIRLFKFLGQDSSFRFGVSDLPQGVYVVKIFYSHNRVAYKTLVKI